MLSAGKVLLFTSGTTLFLARQGIDALPILYLVLAVVATGISLALAAVIDRVRPTLLMPSVAAMGVVCTAGLVAVLAFNWGLAPAALLIAAHIYDIVTDIVFWVLAAACFDNLRLRRLTPRFFMAIAMGGSLAGILAERTLALVDADTLLWPVMGLVCSAALLLARLPADNAFDASRGASEPNASAIGMSTVSPGELRRFMARHPFAFCLALNSLLLTTVYSLTEYVAYAIYTETYPDETELGRLLALLFALLQVAEFVVLWFGSRRIVERARPMLRNLLFPVTSLACLFALLLQPRLGWAILAHLNTEAISNGVFEPVNATNYGALPIDVHGRARTLADGVFYPLGMALAGIMLTLLPPTDAVFRATVLGLIASLFFLLINLVVARTYLPTLLRQVRHGHLSHRGARPQTKPLRHDVGKLLELLNSRNHTHRQLGLELIEASVDSTAPQLLKNALPTLVDAATRLDDRQWIRVAALLGRLQPQVLSAALEAAINDQVLANVELLAAAHILDDRPLLAIARCNAPSAFVTALRTLAIDSPNAAPVGSDALAWAMDPGVRDRVAAVVALAPLGVLTRVVLLRAHLDHLALRSALLTGLAKLPATTELRQLWPLVDDLRRSTSPAHRAAALRFMATRSSLVAGRADPEEGSAAKPPAAEGAFLQRLALAWPALADPTATVRQAAVAILLAEPKQTMHRISAGGRLADPAMPADRARGIIELLAAIGDREARRLLRQLIATLAANAEHDAILLQGLWHIGNPAMRPLRIAVLDHAHRVAELLFSGLAALGDAERAIQLREALREVDTRLRAGTIDGLASLRNGPLARRFIPLLEQLHLFAEPEIGNMRRTAAAVDPDMLATTTGDRWLRAAVELGRQTANGQPQGTVHMQPMLGPKGPPLTDSSALAAIIRLKDFELFAEIPFDVLEPLLHLLEEREFAAGLTVQAPGNALLHAWFVDVGNVTVEWPSGLRESIGPEGCIGETALADPTVVAPAIVASTACRMFRLHRVAFHDLAREHPIMTESLCRLLARSLNRQHGAKARERRMAAPA
jgi:hypothetical protein